MDLHPEKTLNKHGYVNTPSVNEANKIWAVSKDWETLLTKEKSAKSVALSLSIHRLTGSKETIKYLHHCGHGISYKDVQDLNTEWAKGVTPNQQHILPAGFRKGRPVHVSIDNSDGRQQTLTGANTTHYTNGTIFQIETEDPPIQEKNQSTKDSPVYRDEELDAEDFGNYSIKKKVSPPDVAYEDDTNDDLLKWCMARDLAWVSTSAVGGKLSEKEDLEPIGSWTCFMKQVTKVETKKALLDYLPVVPLPPTDKICKWYLDTLMKMIDDLDAEFIFLHADEAVYCKVMMIEWIHQGKYDKVIPLLGGFHTLLVNLKVLRKKYGVLGLKEWWIDSEAIQPGSADKADEGKHYFRSIRLHKQSFESLARFRIEKEINVELFSDGMKEALTKLRENPCTLSLENLMKEPEFVDFTKKIQDTSGTMSQMVVNYMKDVSNMLALVSSVRENCIERHLQAERVLCRDLHALGHPNYSRYLTYQHVMLSTLHEKNPKAWEELLNNGFGGSLSGQPFSTEHGDLIIEMTINKEVKVRGGPMQGGYSTDLKSMNRFVKNTHHMAKLRAALKKKLKILTSSNHKETTSSGKRTHEKMIVRMLDQLKRYLNPFDEQAVRNFKTGEVISEKVINGLLGCSALGEELFQKFIQERLQPANPNDSESTERVSFFAPLKNPKLDTGLKPEKKTAKVINVLKEDKQAFGLLVGKSTSLTEAHSYPLTSVPLALASPDGDLRQSAEASLRNHLMDATNAVEDDALLKATWIIDGMAIICSMNPRVNWGSFCEAFIDNCMPPKELLPAKLEIVMDTYGEGCIKEMTQKRRGTTNRKIVIGGADQAMPKAREWPEFLSDGDNKTELIRFIASYCRNQEFKSTLKVPLVITYEENAWLVTPEEVDKLQNCNHHEADTRIIRHTIKADNPVVVVASDTDILILLVYAYNKFLKDTDRQVQMKIDSERFVNIRTIVDNIPEDAINCLPAYHSITGCDTTSYPFGVGKVRPWNKALKKENKPSGRSRKAD